MARKRRSGKSAPRTERPSEIKTLDTAQGFIVLDSNQVQLGSVVSEKVRLDDVALLTLSANRIDNLGDTSSPLRVHCAVKSNAYGFMEDQGQIVVRPTLTLSAFRRSGDELEEVPAISIEASFALLYTCDNIRQMASEHIEAFANTNGIFNLWPFWRNSS